MYMAHLTPQIFTKGRFFSFRYISVKGHKLYGVGYLTKTYNLLVSCPDPPSGGCGEREKEGLGNNPGWKCPEHRNSATGVD